MVDAPVRATVAQAQRPNWALICAGIVLVLLFAGGALFGRAVGGETKETTASRPAGGTTKVTKTKAVPSDSLLTVLLGTGAALIVIGALYSRITTVKLPGGVEIGLTNDERDKVAEKAGAKASSEHLDASTTATLTAAALREAVRQKTREGQISLSDDALAGAVERAFTAIK